jgi:hypothetical protein
MKHKAFPDFLEIGFVGFNDFGQPATTERGDQI